MASVSCVVWIPHLGNYYCCYYCHCYYDKLFVDSVWSCSRCGSGARSQSSSPVTNLLSHFGQAILPRFLPPWRYQIRSSGLLRAFPAALGYLWLLPAFLTPPPTLSLSPSQGLGASIPFPSFSFLYNSALLTAHSHVLLTCSCPLSLLLIDSCPLFS